MRRPPKEDSPSSAWLRGPRGQHVRLQWETSCPAPRPPLPALRVSCWQPGTLPSVGWGREGSRPGAGTGVSLLPPWRFPGAQEMVICVLPCSGRQPGCHQAQQTRGRWLAKQRRLLWVWGRGRAPPPCAASFLPRLKQGAPGPSHPLPPIPRGMCPHPGGAPPLRPLLPPPGAEVAGLVSPALDLPPKPLPSSLGLSLLQH